MEGHHLDLLELPPPRELRNAIQYTPLEEQTLDTEVSSLLEKGAISPVPENQAYLVSPLFAIPKRDSDKFRTILDLRQLNEFVRYSHFKMDGLGTVKDLLRQGDYMVKIDLTDAFYHVPIARKDRRLLQFRWKDVLYQYNCLPFGLASAPRTFTKVTKPFMVELRSRGFRIVIYIDDILLIASSANLLLRQLSELLSLLESLGLTVNLVKSVLEPTQVLTYLGTGIDSTRMQFFLPDTKVKKVKKACLELLQSTRVTARDLASVLGLLSSTVQAILPAPLHMRELQHLKEECLRSSQRNYQSVVSLRSGSRAELRWWCDRLESVNGKNITAQKPDCIIQTDASKVDRSGWGAQCGEQTAGGRWTARERHLHINVLELKAATLGV